MQTTRNTMPTMPRMITARSYSAASGRRPGNPPGGERRLPSEAMRTAPSAPVVVLSPHLDDAVWSTFSVLSGAGDVVVANVFAGIPEGPPGWWDVKCGITDSAAHVRARRAEDASVLATLGRTPADLDLLDDQYRDGPVGPAEIVAELERQVPAVSHVYAPAGIGHPDHALVRDAGLYLH